VKVVVPCTSILEVQVVHNRW